MSTYQTIPTITNMEQNDDAVAAQMETGNNNDETVGIMDGMVQKTKSSRGLALLMGSLGVVAACMLLLGGSNNSNTAATTNLPLEGMAATSSVRACTLDECFASNCNDKIAPFTCLFHNGGPHGGCSPVEWISYTCTEQCDLSGCDDLIIPDDSPSCATKCSEQWCKEGSCGGDYSFICTNGSARYGCSADEMQWTLRVASTTCSSCCDMSLC